MSDWRPNPHEDGYIVIDVPFEGLPSLVASVALSKPDERILVVHEGSPILALISPDDLALLTALEDAADRRALEEAKAEDAPPLTLADLRAALANES